MQVPILSGIYRDTTSDVRTSLPRNLVPVPKDSGVSKGYLAPADGIKPFAASAPGVGRGGINWNGQCYRVMGPSLVRVEEAGNVVVLGDVGGLGDVSFDYSFDRLAIASGGRMFYWDGSNLTQVTDSDLGVVVDMIWVAGYFMTTDGAFLVVTELNDPYSVDPLKYGSSESDPDPVVALQKVRNEVMALNRYTIEVFQNVGGDGFPFQRIDGAQVQRGCVGTHACVKFMDSVAFVGSGRDEAPAVWIVSGGTSQKLSTREVDILLSSYTEAQLAKAVLDARVDKGHQLLYLGLPDRTLVFDGAGSTALSTPIWFELGSGLLGGAPYRARHLTWAYNRWLLDDTEGPVVGALTNETSTHYGQNVGWEFSTPMFYNEGNGAIIHEMELVAMPGGTPLGKDPVVWTSYSLDGETWSQERATSAGKIGERNKRIAWRRQGKLRNFRLQKFRGTSDSHMPVMRLELRIEGLSD